MEKWQQRGEAEEKGREGKAKKGRGPGKKRPVAMQDETRERAAIKRGKEARQGQVR
jgi:hypothetical protein